MPRHAVRKSYVTIKIFIWYVLIWYIFILVRFSTFSERFTFVKIYMLFSMKFVICSFVKTFRCSSSFIGFKVFFQKFFWIKKFVTKLVSNIFQLRSFFSLAFFVVAILLVYKEVFLESCNRNSDQAFDMFGKVAYRLTLPKNIDYDMRWPKNMVRITLSKMAVDQYLVWNGR